MTARMPILGVTVIALSQLVLAQVSSDRLLNAQKESQNWLTYSGGYMSQRHSQLSASSMSMGYPGILERWQAH